MVKEVLKNGKINIKDLFSEKKGILYNVTVHIDDDGGKFVKLKLELIEKERYLSSEFEMVEALPVSLRVRRGDKVSMPILWEELDTIAPDGNDMKDALLRIEGNDPWKDYFENQQMLK